MIVDEIGTLRFEVALANFLQGATFSFDDVEFWLDRENKTLEIRVSSSWTTRITPAIAMRDFQRGIKVFDFLKLNSSSFADATGAFTPRFSLIEDYKTGAIELAYLSNGKIVWR
jgi:hypothetical protein